MGVCVDRERGGTLEAALEELLPREPELPYANFAPVARRDGAAKALHQRRWREASEADAPALGAWVARSGSRPLAALLALPRPFESEHFGLAMVKLEQPLAPPDPEERTVALRELYAAALAGLRDAGFAHVAARASTRDAVTSWLLQELRGRHVDTQVSWMADLTGQPHDHPPPPPLRVEVHDRDSLARLPREAWNRIARWGGTAFDRGPLVFDLDLPRERALRVYEAWTANVMQGRWADAVVVARDGAEIVAFISMLELPDVSEAAGALVCGRGLGATLPDYRGLFTALQREMVFTRPLGASFMENETQVATIGSINVYARLGFRYLRSTSTFHVSLASPPTSSRTA